jgi:hypothetical protein
MTNPFLKAEVEATIKDMSKNIDTLKSCLRSKKLCSLLLQALYHHQKDGRQILKNGLRYNIDGGQYKSR